MRDFDLLTETLSQLLLKYAVSQLFKRPVSERLTGASENLDVISCVKGVVEINLSWPQIDRNQPLNHSCQLSKMVVDG